MEFHTTAMLEEQRSGLVNQANFDRSNNYDSSTWSYPVGVKTLKLHETVSSIFLQNYESENELIKKLLSVCPKKWNN